MQRLTLVSFVFSLADHLALAQPSLALGSLFFTVLWAAYRRELLPQGATFNLVEQLPSLRFQGVQDTLHSGVFSTHTHYTRLTDLQLHLFPFLFSRNSILARASSLPRHLWSTLPCCCYCYCCCCCCYHLGPCLGSCYTPFSPTSTQHRETGSRTWDYCTCNIGACQKS